MSIAETLACAELRTKLAIRQIDEIKRGEHTHEHPQKILDAIADIINGNLTELGRAAVTDDADVVRNSAANLTLDLDTYLPLLGFILRSSNVRNAFEVFDPLIAMCASLLGPDVSLIYSSEWDYSPFTRTFAFPKLRNVVVVGLPAHKSGSALIVPAVGHELGHAKWKQADLPASHGAQIENDVISYYLRHLDEIIGKKLADEVRAHAQPEMFVAVFVPQVANSQSLAKYQCEEVFCDIVGTRIFGTSYLRAFGYLVFPSPKGMERWDYRYPSNEARIRYMKRSASHFGSRAPEGFGTDYDDVLPKTLAGDERQKVQAADEATENAFPQLLAAVDALIPKEVIPVIDETAVNNLKSAFAKGQPGDGVFLLPDIIDAAWSTHLAALERAPEKLFEGLDFLNELVFKTVEVSEFYRRVIGN